MSQYIKLDPIPAHWNGLICHVDLFPLVGNPITAVYAIPATRPGYSEYFVSSPSTSYHSPSWMSFPPEPDELPPQWADSVRGKSMKSKSLTCSLCATISLQQKLLAQGLINCL